MLKIDFSKDIKMNPNVEKIHKAMESGQVEGNDFLGWLYQPNNIGYVEEIKNTVNLVQKKCDVMLVLGIGGSYLGTKMAYEFLREEFSEDTLYFAGWNLSDSYAIALKKKLKGKKVCVLTISKSGSTLETAKALDFFEDIATEHVVITGENSKLHERAKENNWKTFYLEDNIGGRYSFLTAVSLLPLAFAGFDIDKFVIGQKKALGDLENPNNDAYKYASVRYELSKTLPVELFVMFNPQHTFFAEWLKQLFGETEGKNGKGIFPASALFSTDLHSLGQFIQDGTNCLFETFVRIDSKEGLEKINDIVYNASYNAHTGGGRVVNRITIKKADEETLGYMTYFMFKAAAMTAYLFEVNPFNQPGVEDYKSEIRKLS